MVKRDIDLEEEVNEILPFSKLHFMGVSYLYTRGLQALDN
jgi:hypothetical protein